ncbi:hypothetical protein [Thiomicrorhabdus sp. Milos-T2]|uniref:hypothetical protein n=1 Tax=Thiomicrorhabdus sp. Milos-T2 TaxID=90814 RepID=UPI00049485BD|nr:hypothetical protein [Thiomicrorhabdus sp. Milos-T2]
MSERIKPNAEHRIVDGEVIPENLASIDEKIERAKAYSEQKAEEANLDKEVSPEDVNDLGGDIDPQAPISEGIELDSETHPDKVSFLSRHKTTLLWLSVILAVVVTLYFTRPDMSWQIQRINELQNQVAQLRQDNNALDVRIKEQQQIIADSVKSEVKKSLQDPENAPAVTQADLSQIQQQTQQQIKQLKETVAQLGGQSSEQLDQALKQLQSMTQKAQQELQPNDAQLKALADLEKNLQNQINGFAKKLSELFLFKEEQQVLTKQPPVLKLDMPLDSLQIQQWIVEINTQWILNGRVDKTQKQLLALEQAASLSDFSHTTALARLIGQDLGYLKQVKDKQNKPSQISTDALKEAVNQLSAKNLFTASQREIDQANAESQSESGLDKLMTKFSQMISIKKRSENGDVTPVDDLLKNDVLLQRLSLLVDRLDWGMQTQSVATVKEASNAIKAFVKAHYAKSYSEFNLLLTPFENVEFESKKPLSILKLDQEVNK